MVCSMSMLICTEVQLSPDCVCNVARSIFPCAVALFTTVSQCLHMESPMAMWLFALVCCVDSDVLGLSEH